MGVFQSIFLCPNLVYFLKGSVQKRKMPKMSPFMTLQVYASQFLFPQTQ